jgi:hypothetical protein
MADDFYDSIVIGGCLEPLSVILDSATVANKTSVPDVFIQEILAYTFRNDTWCDSISYMNYSTAVIINDDYYLRMIYSVWVFDPPAVESNKYKVLAWNIHNKIQKDSHAWHGLRKDFVFNGLEVEDLGDINENFLTRQLQIWIASHNITKQIVYTRDLILDEEEYYYYKLLGKSPDLSEIIRGATVAPYWNVPDEFLWECDPSDYETMPNKDYYFRMIYSYFVFDPPKKDSYKYAIIKKAVREKIRRYRGRLFNELNYLVYGSLGDSRYDGCGQLQQKYVNNNALTHQLKSWLKNKKHCV